MIRLILKAPGGLSLDMLPLDQRFALQSIFTGLVLPIPNTIVSGIQTIEITKPEHEDISGEIIPETSVTLLGECVADAIVADDADLSILNDLYFEILASWKWDLVNDLETLIPLPDSFINFLSPTYEFDIDGNIISETAPSHLYIPHNWAGWPEVNV